MLPVEHNAGLYSPRGGRRGPVTLETLALRAASVGGQSHGVRGSSWAAQSPPPRWWQVQNNSGLVFPLRGSVLANAAWGLLPRKKLKAAVCTLVHNLPLQPGPAL